MLSEQRVHRVVEDLPRYKSLGLAERLIDRGHKTAEGHATAEFEDLTPQIQQAWDAACEGAVRHWLENEFKTAVLDDALLEAYAGRMLAVGVERKDPPLQTLRAAVASFVRRVIDPTAGQKLKLRKEL